MGPWGGPGEAPGLRVVKIQRNSELKVGIIFFKMLFCIHSPYTQIRFIYSYMLLYNHLLKNRDAVNIFAH